MFYQKKVREYYDQAVKLNSVISGDLRDALRSNERIPTFIDNLAIEIEKVQSQRLIKGKSPHSPKIIQELVYDMTNIFITGIENAANERIKSDAQKQVEASNAQYKKDLDQSSSGKLTGDFQELSERGFVTTEERSN